MKLKNNFSTKTRWLFFDVRYSCWICGGNGQDCSGTELHHIASRISKSPLNASVLCKKCHAEIKHTEEEEVYLFKKTFMYLLKIGYTFSNEDIQFAKKYKRLEKAIRNCGAEINL